MPYNFDEIYDRKGRASEKWEAMWRTAKEEGIALRGGETPMTIADMEFRAAPEICTALKNLAEFGLWGYTLGDEHLKSAVAGWFAKRHGWRPKEEWQVITSGVVPALYMAVRCFTAPGDGVIIQPPVYPPFRHAVEASGRKLIENPLRIEGGKYRMNLADLREKAKGAKMLILCSPHNPVGRVWQEEELLALAEVCRENNLLLISDEIHCDLILSDKSFISMAKIAEKMENNFLQNLVIATAASKSFSLAGLSTSSVVIPSAERRRQFTCAQENSAQLYNNTFGRTATIAAYEQGEPWLEELLLYLRGNRNWLKAYLETNFPNVKMYEIEGTYLAWVDFSCLGLTQDEMLRLFRERAGVFFSNGEAFGKEGVGHVRINIACPRKTLQQAMERLLAAMPGLKS